MRNVKMKYYYLTFLTIIFLSACTKDKSTISGSSDDTGNYTHIETTKLIAVYPNAGNEIYLVDWKSLNIVRKITVNHPDTLWISGMCLSTSRDYFVFSAATKSAYDHYILSFNIKKNTIHNVFHTGLSKVAPRMMAAHIPSEPGLIYLYSHLNGLFSIDFFSKAVNKISSTNFSTGKDFFYSPDKQWIVINKYVPNYTELEFYKAGNVLQHPDFVLNKNDVDSVDIMDLAFSEDNKKLYISYLISERRMVRKAAFFSSYNLETKKRSRSRLALPWSNNPYYLEHSFNRDEAYLVGAQNLFYIVDTKSDKNNLKAAIKLSGKDPGPSKILLSPDENTAFVSCANNNFILVIDLEQREVVKQINVPAPYLLLKL